LHCRGESFREHGHRLLHQGTQHDLPTGIQPRQIQTQNCSFYTTQIHPNDGFIRQLKQYESKAKTEEKKRDTSPANYKYTPASTKRSTYGPTHDYPQFKSSTFIPDTTDPKKPQRIAEAYKSYELTPKKADYRQQYAQKENA